MVTLALDTSELVWVLRARSGIDRMGYDDAVLSGIVPVVSAIVVQELVRGAETSARPEARLKQLDRLLAELTLVDFSVEDGRAAGRVSARLRRIGRPIGDIDTLIAGQALARGWTLVTRNVRHFGRVEGLPLIDWSVSPDPLPPAEIARRVEAEV